MRASHLLYSIERIFINAGMAEKVAKVQKCTESLDHLQQNVASYCRKIDLFNRAVRGQNVQYHLLTFMRAFESSPVHCLNPRPSGKCRRPGKDGDAAILLKISQWCHGNAAETHWWSISESIVVACDFPCNLTRYCSTHSMRWFLNIPLMTWWSKSGEISWWMLAWGKFAVNG